MPIFRTKKSHLVERIAIDGILVLVIFLVINLEHTGLFSLLFTILHFVLNNSNSKGPTLEYGQFAMQVRCQSKLVATDSDLS